MNQQRSYSQTSFDDKLFSESSKEKFLKCLSRSTDMNTFKSTLKFKPSRAAAVLVPLCMIEGKPSVLLTVRSSTVGRSKGEVSFPGGMQDYSDKDAVHAALRETEEEIGIAVASSCIWTIMSPLPNRAGGITVTPVIAYVGNINLKNCRINTDEVESVFAPTLESLCDPVNWRYTQYKKGYSLPVYVNGEHPIWGLTSSVLHVILQALLPGVYKNKLKFMALKKIVLKQDH